MRIYSMTATFGKLEHDTLTLEPGLNVVEAPNEWGKSTWCAFLTAMLYGIETRVHSTKTALADKERYLPWSGSPMSGRIDLNWNGRDITIERTTKGRSVFGQFRAYETDTGLEVTELTASNCGQMLLGVEKSVFVRAGFLRLTDLPVTQDESLRRRLNALVTTGDESGTADVLAQKLKDLKNRCRANRANGLIPQAQAQKDELERKLREQSELREQAQRIKSRQEALTAHIQKLENHKAVLEYASAQEYTQKALAARHHVEEVNARVAELERVCDALPAEEELLRRISCLQQLRQQRESLQLEAQLQAAAPAVPEIPACFRGCTPEQALQQAAEDRKAYEECNTRKKKTVPALLIAGIVLGICGAVTWMLLQQMIPGILLVILAVGCIAAELVRGSAAARSAEALRNRAERLLERYRPLAPDYWEAAADQYALAQKEYEEKLRAYRTELAGLRERTQNIAEQINALTEGRSYLQCEQQWQQALECRKELAAALREQRRAADMALAFTQDRKLPRIPDMPDEMTFTQAQTVRLLADAEQERHQLQLKLGHCQGQMETLGQEETLRQQLSSTKRRLEKLEDTYSALELALNTLNAASNELQRRFAPRISRRAQELFGKLTADRYDRLTLGEDLTLSAGAQGEDTLRPSLWRSDGTVDQLYLALRLAVSEELTPDAPLVLDDALVRFDDGRLAAAMEILRQCARDKQVILFTCQSREKALL